MARLRGTESTPYDEDNPYEPRHRQKEKKWYKNKWVWIIGAILVVFLYLGATGHLNLPFSAAEKNETAAPSQLTEQQQLVQYVVEQQAAGTTKEDIVTRLRLAGYKDAQIDEAFLLADPIIQYIMDQMAGGVPKATIVEALLKEGHTPAQIQGYFETIESAGQKGLGQTLADNWWVLAILAGIAFLVYRKQEADKKKRAPKVYTLEECREYAEELLKGKKIDFNPTTEYRNRPEIKQYRYVFEEPIYPEFNSHRPTGHRFANRQYYLVAVGYDRELVDFCITEDDTTCREFLQGAPRSYESRAATEYVRLRERSEMPIEEAKAREQPGPYGAPGMGPQYRSPYRRRPAPRRYSPGPIGGYEEI